MGRATYGRTLIHRAIGISLGGFTFCLIAEFVADYFNLQGFRGNSAVTMKLNRAFGAIFLFGVPYFIVTSPLALLRTTGTRSLRCYPLVGGAIGTLVARAMIAYGEEIQAAIGVGNSEVFVVAAGCGVAAGSASEVVARMMMAVVRHGRLPAVAGRYRYLDEWKE